MRVSLTASLLLPLTLLNLPSRSSADKTTIIIPTSNWGTWDGWGTSLAWWARAFGNNDLLADIFFTTSWPSFSGRLIPGLGLNIARYNAGASSWNSIGGTTMVVAPHMAPSRQIEGFWQDWYSADPGSSSWNWNADSTQRAMLAKAKVRGANHFELFSNSPMWWMCYNHDPAGAADGSTENLQNWNYNAHAVYLANIVQQAQNNWGIAFESVEPFNEPSSNWWSEVTSQQEGCRFFWGTISTVMGEVRSELNKRSLWGTVVAAADENSYDGALGTWNAMNTNDRNNIGRVNVHGYQEGSGDRSGLFNAANSWGKKIWNTEYGENDSSGARLVSNLILDFRWLHPTAWCYWQVLDGGGWGLIDADPGTGRIGGVSQKYYILAMFTRHIREGMRILDGGSDYTVAAYDYGRQKLIIVAVNWGAGQWINFDLSKFSKPGVSGAKVLRWKTQIGSGDQYADYSDTYLSGTKFWSWFDQNVVMTFEVDNVVL